MAEAVGPRVRGTRLDPELEAMLTRQRNRVRKDLERGHARLQRKLSQLDRQPDIETRGTPQTFHRDVTNGYGWDAEW